MLIYHLMKMGTGSRSYVESSHRFRSDSCMVATADRMLLSSIVLQVEDRCQATHVEIYNSSRRIRRSDKHNPSLKVRNEGSLLASYTRA